MNRFFVNKEVYKRLYHNLPYLAKTKGGYNYNTKAKKTNKGGGGINLGSLLGGLFGGGVNTDSSDAAIILRTGSVEMYVEKPTAFRFPVDITGSLNVSGNLTASLQQGYIWVGNAAGKTTAISTGSFITESETGSRPTPGRWRTCPWDDRTRAACPDRPRPVPRRPDRRPKPASREPARPRRRSHAGDSRAARPGERRRRWRRCPRPRRCGCWTRPCPRSSSRMRS